MIYWLVAISSQSSVISKENSLDKDTNNKVVIYGAEWCPPCHMLKEYLHHLKVDYDYIDIDKQRQAGMDISQKTGWSSIPIVKIGDEYILGFDRQKVTEALRVNKLLA